MECNQGSSLLVIRKLRTKNGLEFLKLKLTVSWCVFYLPLQDITPNTTSFEDDLKLVNPTTQNAGANTSVDTAKGMKFYFYPIALCEGVLRSGDSFRGRYLEQL